MSLPEWSELSKKADRKEELDPVEYFIYEHEPAGKSEDKFRKDFEKALLFYAGR